MRFIALTFVMFFVTGPATAAGWREYSYPGYFFSVTFPAEPKNETTKYEAIGGGSVEAHVYSVSQAIALFKMTVVDLADSTIEANAVIDHAIKTLSGDGEIKLNIPQRIRRVWGRQLSVVGADGSHVTFAVFFYKGRLYQIEGRALGEDANVDATRFVQSLVFTDKANAAWPQLVERFRSDCRRQFQYLRGPGQAANVSEHVRGCVVAKVRAETGRAGVGEAGAGP